MSLCNINGFHIFDCSVKRAKVIVSAESCVYTAIKVPCRNDVVVMHQVGLVEMLVKNYTEANIVTVSGQNGHGGFMVLKHW